mmetsp:Transcript_41308/g.39778  ORF Transcript_41308/g.39778 Transcript_41308/m.39778 type:complete len:141 (+) Transcript_41308:339-761(+)|eukprot:CAMPEP_0170547384 /NCGR_PEP_ID=MMETSP0211-20121228/5780_1 /TAXON_ID=311385 /ORGANISM="Pseudokeronopsis sp., Strain OXSARD2" /LENGTH=140 /DNA_ID=CAMNT_0010852399 /DNA_START=331 /DNA_END=753 /DNA_ORIENTATION=+
MRLVEVVRGEETSDETVDITLGMAKRLGKVPVVSKDSPAFINNRILSQYVNSGIQALEDEIATQEEIDKTMTAGLDFPIGPIALADLIGLDVIELASRNLANTMGDPKYLASSITKKLVAEGNLGTKTGKGFYTYGKKKL